MSLSEDKFSIDGWPMAILAAPATASDSFTGVSKLIDAVAFWNSYGAPETRLIFRSDTQWSF